MDSGSIYLSSLNFDICSQREKLAAFNTQQTSGSSLVQFLTDEETEEEEGLKNVCGSYMRKEIYRFKNALSQMLTIFRNEAEK